MSPILIKAVVAITLALVFYTIGVWSEHRAKLLKTVHLADSFPAGDDYGDEIKERFMTLKWHEQQPLCGLGLVKK